VAIGGRERESGRAEEREGRHGGAEEAGEQVQGAGRQAAAGLDPTPDSSLLLPRCGSAFLLSVRENGRDFAVI
jgi:hypothetical protein